MKISDAVFGVLLALLGGAILWQVRSFPAIPGQEYGAGVFPGVIASGLVVVGVLLTLSGLRQRATAPWLRFADWVGSRRHVTGLLAIILGTVAYILFADQLGFLVLAPVVLAVWLLALGTRPLATLALAVVVSAIIWFAFYKLLRVPLPWGVLKSFAF